MSQPVSNILDGLSRMSPEIAVGLEGLQPAIQHFSLFRREWQSTLIFYNAVPEILRQLDALVDGEMCQLCFHVCWILLTLCVSNIGPLWF